MTSRLASLLVQDGHITAQKMAEAFQRQVLHGGTLDTALLELGLVDEELLIDYLCVAAELPLPDLPRTEPGESPASLWLPSSLAQRFHVAPIALDGQTLQVAVTEPPNRAELTELGRMLDHAVDARVVPEYRLYQALERVYFLPMPARFSSLAAKMAERAEMLGRDPMAPRTPTRKVAPEVRIFEAEPGGDDELGPEAEVKPFLHGGPRLAETVEDEAPPRGSPIEPHVPPTALPHEEGMETLQKATDRDTILVTLCRMARARFSFAAIYTVHGEIACARVALGERWLDGQLLVHGAIPLDRPSSFRAAILGRAPYLGRIDEDAPTAHVLRVLGRPTRLWAALLPVSILDRTVAVLHADDQGRRLDAAELSELILAATEASLAFQRLILRGKSRRFQLAPSARMSIAAAPVGTTVPSPTPNAAMALRKPASLTPSAQDFTERHRTTNPGFRRRKTDELPRFIPADRQKRIEAALVTVEAEGPDAAAAADELLVFGDDAAWSLARRLPGPLRVAGSALGSEAPARMREGPLLALAPRFGRSILPHLIARMESPSLELRLCVTLALGALHLPEAARPLGARLFDHEPLVRRAALAALGRMAPGPELMTVLESLHGELGAEDPARQRYAAESLGELRDAPSVPRLIELVKHREVDVVDAAHRALMLITKQDFGGSRWRWRVWWEKNGDLSRIDWLLAGLRSPESEVRLSASEELQTLTSDVFCYQLALPRAQREAARQKWLAWYKQTLAAPASDGNKEPGSR